MSGKITKVATKMYSTFLLSVLLSSVLAKGGIEDNDAASEFYGKYKLAYVWPKITKPVPNCMEVVYSEAKNLTEDPFTCQCERASPNLAFVLQKAHRFFTAVLADIVKNPEEISLALNDKCHCEPLDKKRTVFMKVNDNYFIQYDLDLHARIYLFSKKMPIEAEVNDIIQNYEDLREKNGMLVCK